MRAGKTPPYDQEFITGSGWWSALYITVGTRKKEEEGGIEESGTRTNRQKEAVGAHKALPDSTKQL
jgi:hypothetical protein